LIAELMGEIFIEPVLTLELSLSTIPEGVRAYRSVISRHGRVPTVL